MIVKGGKMFDEVRQDVAVLIVNLTGAGMVRVMPISHIQGTDLGRRDKIQ